MESRDVSCDTGGGESPTQLVRQILRQRDPVSQPANGEEDIAATVSVMLRVQPPSKALLMVGAELCERLRLALQEAGFEVTIAPTKDRAIDALASQHHTLAVTDRLEFVRSLRALGTSRVLQIIQITSGLDGELEAALSCGADECLNGEAPDMLLQARFLAARRMSDLESALRATFIVGHRLATTDQLTEVANRRFYAKHYPREISRAARYGRIHASVTTALESLIQTALGLHVLTRLSALRRTYAEFLQKGPRKVCKIREAYFMGDYGYVAVGLPQQMSSAPQPHQDQSSPWRSAHVRFKAALQVTYGDVDF